ncbi:MAG: 2Fe-2S iron-sulfur cluster-binding protein, partial [Bradymonadaceae bacterium]
ARKLNPVQQALVDRGGSQCGFCTPGFVVSMCWYMIGGLGEPTLDGFKRAFSGNLCRCTGYSSIFRASEDLVAAFGPSGDWSEIWSA